MTQPISSYLGLITSQYQNSPKFLEWLTSALQVFNDISTCADMMPTYFDLDSAVGVQLDAIGSLLGQLRVLPFQPSDGSAALLDDVNYRKILKLKTLTNYWDGTQDGIYEAWATVFPDVSLVITDHQDMSAIVTFTGSLSQIVIDMIQNDLVIPRPEGVNYGFGEIENIAIFSYDEDTSQFKGYDESYWDVTL